MASGFPGSIDNFTDPLANSPLNSPSHATLHSDVNDAVEKIETYMGLVKVIPTSVVGGALSADGTITCSGTAATVNVNGAFTSTYANYKIICSWDAASSGTNYVTMRMRASGTDTSTSIYTSYASWTSTASTGVDRYTSSDSWRVMFYSPGGRAQLEMLITAPQLAKNTTFFATSLDVRTTDFVGQTGAGVIRDTVQYDGFTFIAPGNVNGTIRIYGMRN